MPHEPFIWGAYGFAALTLIWCALAPLLRHRKLAAQLRARYVNDKNGHASRA